jgi:hypothetical protein
MRDFASPSPIQPTKIPLPTAGLSQSSEPIRYPEPLNLDTATPMVKEGAVSRFLNVDVQRYGPWLIPKLTTRWPQISAMTFSGWVMGWTGGNTFLFVKTPNAVGLAEIYKQTPELRVKAREVFAFCNGKDHEDEILTLYKEFKRWGKSLGVSEIIDIGNASDLSPKRLRENAGAKTDNGLMFEI